MTRKCEVCGKTLKRGQDRFCSYRCHGAASRVENKSMTCPTCGREFMPSVKHRRDQRYCSKSCAQRAIAAAKRLERPPTKRVLEPVKCEWCGREFTPTRNGQRFCSRECNLSSRGKGRKGDPISIRRSQDCGCPCQDVDKVRAYLALPPAERWAKRGTLTEAELKLAAKMHDEAHSHRAVEWNWLPH